MKNNIDQNEYKHISEIGLYTLEDQIKHDEYLIKKPYEGKTREQLLDYYLKNDPNLNLDFVSDSGVIKIVPLKVKAKQDVCIIDWVNFTVNEESYNSQFVLTDSDLIQLVSEKLDHIFGFGITLVRPNGAMFYDRSYQVGDKYGLVCHGGNNTTILVSINGTGLMNAKQNWETRLFRFLQTAIQPSITRLDLAHDIYHAPKFLLDHYLGQYDTGGFTTYRQKPSISQIGNWFTEDNKGRTLYIGSRKSGLYLRIYEKGLELKSNDFPTWLRLEAEIKAIDRIIPQDALLNPHDYFAGLYPCFRTFNRKALRIETFKKELNADFDKRIKWGKHQTGGLIHLMKELNFSDQEIIQALEGTKIPQQFQRQFLGNTLTTIHTEPASEIANTNPLEYITL
jgi:phage replication initiation protein